MLRSLTVSLAFLAAAPLVHAQTGEIVDARTSPQQRIVEMGDTMDTLLAENRFVKVSSASRVPREAVRYRVRGEHTGDATPILVRLAETDALRSLSTSGTPDGETFVDATFAFATVAEWASWTERDETRALLAELSDGQRGLRTDLDVNR